MASSPPASSFIASINPKKRPSISSSVSQPGVKRPKISSSLRKTSFAASDAPLYTSARSETGSLANSTFSTTSATKPPARGRGRPRKSATIHDDDVRGTQAGESASQIGKRARSVVSGAGGAANAVDNEGDEQEEDEADISNMLGSTTHEAEEETRQTIRRDRLRTAFSQDQDLRFEKWRAVSLKLGAVRKIVNQTTSQSVTPAPLQAIQVYGKWFVAEIVERAREVQAEWAVAYEVRQKEIKEDRQDKLQTLEKKLREEGPKLTEWDRRRLSQQVDRARKEVDEYVPNPNKGGLLPDHLREALRRYKADGDTGGTGFEGLSHPLLGLHGSGVWTIGDGATGRRLFR